MREILAGLGARTVDEIIGHTELLQQVVVGADAGNLDLLPLLWAPDTGNVRRNVDARNPLRSSSPLGDRLTADVLAALQSFEFEGRDLRAERERLPARLAQYPAVHLSYAIRNIDRTVGGKLSGELAKRYGDAGLPPHTIVAELRGNAGQSFGAWLLRGLSLRLVGQANDYVGKGLAGGEIVIRPPDEARVRLAPQRDPRQHGAVRRDGRRALRRGPRGRALRRAQLRRAGGGRRRGRSRLRVHDRRRGGRVGPDGPQLRRRDDGRRRVRLR